MSWNRAPGGGRRSGPAGLDLRQAVDAAVSVVDHDGFGALPMRKVGTYLGVEAMALYHYVSGREALLDAVVDTVIDELHRDPEVHLSSPNWPDYIRRLAHGIRRLALAYPKGFPLVATRPPTAPWVRPPLRSLRWMESFLQNLLDNGFTDRAAVCAYRSFTSFLLGHLLLEVSAAGADVRPVDDPVARPAKVDDLDGYPLLQELQPLLWAQDRSAEVFNGSLELLVNDLQNLNAK